MQWEHYFLEIAQAVAAKSKDPSTKVGAVIVDKNHKIISTGYNGFLPKYPDTEENWTKPLKYSLVVHAELNSLLYAKQDLKDCTLYCTLQPCAECMKALLVAGVSEVYYIEDRHDEIAQTLAKFYNVKMIKVTM